MIFLCYNNFMTIKEQYLKVLHDQKTLLEPYILGKMNKLTIGQVLLMNQILNNALLKSHNVNCLNNEVSQEELDYELKKLEEYKNVFLPDNLITVDFKRKEKCH